jgi:hypothetical protein
VYRLSQISAGPVCDVAHRSAECFREVSIPVDGTSVIVSQLISCD